MLRHVTVHFKASELPPDSMIGFVSLAEGLLNLDQRRVSSLYAKI